jgi:hypothetical protein
LNFLPKDREMRYLAPLNYDRFFKKVFSEINIAKRFLEDFLDMPIDDIQPLDKKKNVTDDSKSVEFDFRCRIKGRDVIIDMQQWYKQDVIQRFYTYHTLSTGLQLEGLPNKIFVLNKETGTAKEIKDYRCLNPVLTIIWMVEDSLNFTNNYVSYIMLPEAVLHFIQHKEIWSNQNLVKILEEHKIVREMIGNTTKDLDFLPQNRLIFMFQKNIIKDTKKITKYHRWFRFANKTKKEDNRKEDFDEFTEDPIFVEMMRRLTLEVLTEDEIKYITDEAEFLEKSKRLEEGMYEVGKKEGIYLSKLIIEEKDKTIEEKDKAIEEKDKTIEEKDKAIEEKDKAIEEKDKALADEKMKTEIERQQKENQIFNLVKLLKSNGFSNEIIAQQTGLNMDDIQNI